MKAVRLHVDRTLLEAKLCLPDSARVINVRLTDDPEIVEFFVVDDTLPAVGNGDAIPVASPLLEQDGDEVIWDWNL